jgi:aspartyl-tRNA(Asn)/glutamyl-tRNA(Gln) amidotransferase subunit C
MTWMLGDDTQEGFLSPEGIRRVARLAKLRIDSGDAGRWVEQMERIVEHVRTLREIPDSDLPATAPPSETTLRLDEATPGAGREELTKNAGVMLHGLVPVPRVVDPAR